MANQRNSNLVNLGILAGIVLATFALGYITGHLALVTVIFKAIILILISITILVTVHELGHFLAAKAFGIKVDIFSIGFPPKLFSFKRGETDYQIGAIPLGGYVKIAGMIDESMDQEVIERERQREQAERSSDRNAGSYGPKPWEFRSKPIWQRLVVMSAGVIMNVILGVSIFTAHRYMEGDTQTPIAEIEGGIKVWGGDSTSFGSLLGFKTGDELVSFKGEALQYIEEYQRQDILLESGAYFEVKRNGETIRLDVPPSIQNYMGDEEVIPFLFYYKQTSHLRILDKGTRSSNGEKIGPAAYEAGMRTGDRLIRLNDTPIKWFADIPDFLQGKANQDVQAVYLRGSDTLSTTISLNENGYMGVAPYTEVIKYTLLSALPVGAREAFRLVQSNAQGFANLGKKGVDPGKSVMGLPQIAWRFVSVWEARGVAGFLWFTGALSMILAFINILPIPVFDGGHIVFLLIEAITRREPSVKVRLVAQQFGLLLILGLMILVIVNDIIQMAS